MSLLANEAITRSSQDPLLTRTDSPGDQSSPPRELFLSMGSSVVSADDDDSSGNSQVSHRVNSVFGSVANLCSATLGAGVLGLPFAFYQAGMLYGLVLLAVSGWATVYSIDMLVVASSVHGERTYEDLVEKLLGSKMRALVEFMIVIFCLGAMVAYVVIVGDILQETSICDEDTRWKYETLVWAVIMVPLSMAKTMTALQTASSVSILSIGTLLGAALWHLLTSHTDYESDDESSSIIEIFTNFDTALWYPANGVVSILRACPIIIFAFSCQVNVPAIFDELPVELDRAQKLDRMSAIAWIGMSVCSFLYVCISAIGLLDFGGTVDPNILSSYDPGSVMELAFFCMAVAVIMAFPVTVFPARVTIFGAIDQWISGQSRYSGPREGTSTDEEAAGAALAEPLLASEANQKSDKPTRTREVPDAVTESTMAASDEEPTTGCSWRQRFYEEVEHFGVTMLLCLTALFLALVTPNISVVFGLVGGSTASMLGFVIPGMVGLKTVDDISSKVLCWILVIGGSVIGILTTIVTAYAEFN